jgi:ArsR family transcriptional regulator, arsenate/arsenite/antimonite-responsive transcriptional repressor
MRYDPHMTSEEHLVAGRMKALGHPVRLGIAMRLAAEPETCACDFADVFQVSQPTISQHLRVLREAGLVTTRRRGTQICYSLDPAAVRSLGKTLAVLARPALRTAG